MLLSLVTFASLALAASPKPDLTSSFTAPTATPYVYQSGAVKVNVKNVGTATAASASVVIQLPVTNTSPGVYTMGTVGTMTSGCTASGTKVTCALGSMAKNTTKSVTINITLPESIGTLDFSAHAATTTTESSTTNNDSSYVATLNNYVVPTTASMNVTNRHCTGTGLESFFECELFPSSISEHEAVFNSDGTVSIPGYPDYSGAWSVVGDELTFNYSYFGTIEAEFVGYGVDSTNCWEGETTFPGSPYNSMYEVCTH